MIDPMKYINDYGNLKLSKKKLFKILDENGGAAIYQKYRSKIKAAAEYRSTKLVERNLEVVYITGTSGSGKTTLAKYLSDKLNLDYFVSGSGEDFLDGYDREECIILDDFRASSMRFSEALKFLDNNTNSSVRSRYYNKDISSCRLIFITSVQEPQLLYGLFKQDDMVQEPAKQFFRRLGDKYYKIEDDGRIRGYHIINISEDELNGENLGNINDVFDELGIDPSNPHKDSLLSGFIRHEHRRS